MSQIKPIGARLLVKREAPQTTQGGIYLPESAQETPKKGTIIAMGHEVDSQLKEGDQVYFSSYAGSEVSAADETGLLILPVDEVLCVVE